MKSMKNGNGAKSMGKPPATIGGALGGVTAPPSGAIPANATLARGGGISAKGAKRSAGEKGRAVPDNCDKIAPDVGYSMGDY